MKNSTYKLTMTTLALCIVSPFVKAEVSLSNIFSDHMVLQRDMANPVWGKATPGEKISVSIANQKHSTIADANGNWRVKLAPLEVGGSHKLTVTGNNTVSFDDV